MYFYVLLERNALPYTLQVILNELLLKKPKGEFFYNGYS
jgi:hypothetical protein